MADESLLGYYQAHTINPVPIALDDDRAWRVHCAKRANLYRHLGVPVGLVRGRRVVEFGCNSGENALVLAAQGARLTLVEPHAEVLPRLHELFDRFGLHDRVDAVANTDIAGFADPGPFDVVLAEGFLNCLDDRDAALAKLCGLLRAGGVGVVSFDDRYGHLLEVVRQLLYRAACRFAGIEDPRAQSGLSLAERLFAEEFAALAASRPFCAWWEDVLNNPFVAARYFWSYAQVVDLVDRAGCAVLSTSPRWSLVDHYRWYKALEPTRTRHERLLADWSRAFGFFLTGRPPAAEAPAATLEAVAGAAQLVEQVSAYTWAPGAPRPRVAGALAAWCARAGADLARFAEELATVLEALESADAEALVAAWHGAGFLRGLWGAPYHYVSFERTA